jgi:hypothetical protein
MEDTYGASKGPYQFLGAIDTIELNDFIQEFRYFVWYATVAKPAIIYTFLGMERFILASGGTAHEWLSWVL